MATIKVFSSEGVKELKCFDTLVSIPYLVVEKDEEISDSEDLESEE